MLHVLRIQDLALVEDLSIEFAPGFNVLTGETGAGKSIIVGALSLLVGQRADRSAIRTGADRCVVEAILRVPGEPAVNSLLKEQGINTDPDGELVLRRIVAASGANRQFVNGAAVPVATLAALGALLVDMHGPHDHQSLLRAPAQLDLLDGYADAGAARDRCLGAWTEIRDARRRIEELSGDDLDIARQIEMLRFQSTEISDAKLEPGEDEELREQYRRASHAEQIRELTAAAAAILSEDDDSVGDRLGGVVRRLEELAALDGEAQELAEAARTAAIGVQELSESLLRYGTDLETDSEALRQMQDRLDLIESLRRKYGRTVEEIVAFGDRACNRLTELEGRGEEIECLEQRAAEARGRLDEEILALRAMRRRGTRRVVRAVGGDLERLGFSGAALDVRVDPAEAGPTGGDRVEFLFSPNPGEDARPLRSIASSGEVSRVMLALKAAFAEQDRVPVLVFDEIDVNVGGEVAHAVGETMGRIAARRQVICITHLPQVACVGGRQFRVEKHVRGDRTRTTVDTVAGDDRVEEIARMLGGATRAAVARDHARELLAAAERAAAP